MGKGCCGKENLEDHVCLWFSNRSNLQETRKPNKHVENPERSNKHFLDVNTNNNYFNISLTYHPITNPSFYTYFSFTGSDFVPEQSGARKNDVTVEETTIAHANKPGPLYTPDVADKNPSKENNYDSCIFSDICSSSSNEIQNFSNSKNNNKQVTENLSDSNKMILDKPVARQDTCDNSLSRSVVTKEGTNVKSKRAIKAPAKLKDYIT